MRIYFDLEYKESLEDGANFSFDGFSVTKDEKEYWFYVSGCFYYEVKGNSLTGQFKGETVYTELHEDGQHQLVSISNKEIDEFFANTDKIALCEVLFCDESKELNIAPVKGTLRIEGFDKTTTLPFHTFSTQ